MEKVEGQHLLDYIYEHGKVDETTAKTITRQILEAL